jgi:hypothetical protein
VPRSFGAHRDVLRCRKGHRSGIQKTRSENADIPDSEIDVVRLRVVFLREVVFPLRFVSTRRNGHGPQVRNAYSVQSRARLRNCFRCSYVACLPSPRPRQRPTAGHTAIAVREVAAGSACRCLGSTSRSSPKVPLCPSILGKPSTASPIVARAAV